MKRFYTVAAAVPVDGGWQVMLDGRGVKTPGARAQIVPTQALAVALAQEWADQGEEIDPAKFVLRDMADYAIDVVMPDPAAAVAALVPYGETDTLCYRAEPGDVLHRRQLAEWEPLIAAAERRWDVAFLRISGVMHQPQPEETVARMRAAIAALEPFPLAALRSLAGLSASLVIALAALEPDADGQALWAAASLEEIHQAELWGDDAEEAARRAVRGRDFLAAIRFVQLSKPAG